MPLPSFWKVVEDTLQQSGAQLHAFCQAFETVTPSPGTQVGGTGHISGQDGSRERWDCGFQEHRIPLLGSLAQNLAQGAATVFPPSP